MSHVQGLAGPPLSLSLSLGTIYLHLLSFNFLSAKAGSRILTPAGSCVR